MISPLTLTRSVRDPEWLTLEVCREFVRNKCARSEDDCKYAHPPPQVEVQNGKVICCYDSLQSRCFRHDPPCKYFHPPPHLRDQITQTRRPHILSPNYQSFPTALGVPSVVSGLVPFAIQNSSPYSFSAAHHPPAANTGTGGLNNYKQLLESLMSTTANLNTPQQAWVVPSIQFATPRQARSDRLEVCREFQRGVCCRPPTECKYAHPPPGVSLDADNHVTVCIDYLKERCTRESCRYFHPPMHLQTQLKSSATASSSFLQLQQQQQQQQQQSQQQQQHQQQQRAASISLTNAGNLYGATNINNTNNNSLVAAWPIIQNVPQQPASLTLSQYQQLAAIISLQQQQQQQQQQQHMQHQQMQQLLQQNVQQLQLQQQQLLLGGNGSLIATTTSTSSEVYRP